jgi:hypothetical protein
MNEQGKRKCHIGTIVSADLTVSNANQLKDFYAQVIGWTPEELKMGDDRGYADYVMKDSGGNWAGGTSRPPFGRKTRAGKPCQY